MPRNQKLEQLENLIPKNFASLMQTIELSVSRTQVKHSFHEFIKQAWPAIEGGVSFVDSWHIQAIAKHLEACYSRQIKKLLINIPPRTSCCAPAILVHPCAR